MRVFVNIDVDDLDKAIAFYTAAFELRLARRLFAGSVAELVGATATIQLLLKPAASRPAPSSESTRDHRRHWTPVHLDFAVHDIAAAVDRATRAGANLEGEIECHAWGRLATMSDPFGHGFCFVQLSRAGYDAAA